MLELDEVLNWQFWTATLFIAAAVWFLKRMVSQLSPATVDKGWFKSVLTACNIAFGLVAASLPGYLKGDTLGERMMLGVIAAMTSNYVYDLVITRLLTKFGGPAAAEGVPKSERKTPPSRPTAAP